MISELRRAFEIGFLIFLPFLIIDMVVASVLMSMGMMMLPPVMVSLPFKLIFFVLVDGWALVVGSLVQSFAAASRDGSGPAQRTQSSSGPSWPMRRSMIFAAPDDVRRRPAGDHTRGLGSTAAIRAASRSVRRAGGLAEIGLRGRLRTVDPRPGLGDVEIDLHDPALGPDQLDLGCQHGLEQLAQRDRAPARAACSSPPAS